MRGYDEINIPVTKFVLAGDIARWMADIVEPIRVREFYKITIIGDNRQNEESIQGDYDFLIQIFKDDMYLLVDDESQRQLHKLSHLKMSKEQYRVSLKLPATDEELLMFRGKPFTKSELQYILQLKFNASHEQLKFIVLLRAMKKNQWPHFYRLFECAANKPAWDLKIRFSDENKSWKNRRDMIEKNMLSMLNVSFAHGELPGVLTPNKLPENRLHENSIVPIESAQDYMWRNGVELQTQGKLEEKALFTLQKLGKIDWATMARIIADECFDKDTENGCRDSLIGYSERVMKIMQERKISGPRGIIDNPNTIMRDALQGKQWWQKKEKWNSYYLGNPGKSGK